MTKERIEEIANVIVTRGNVPQWKALMIEILSALPEFQEPHQANMLIDVWRGKARKSREEAGRIRCMVHVATDAEERCNARAELWDECADELSEFQEPRWTLCSERMPIEINYQYATRVTGIDHWQRQSLPFSSRTTHWYNVWAFIPAPPVEEDSPIVKELKALKIVCEAKPDGWAIRDAPNAVTEAIEIVKRHEKKG